MPPDRWFDGHLDLAYLAEIGRDLHAEPAEARGRLMPAAVTLPSLRAGGVRACLATVFTEAVDPGSRNPETAAFAFPMGDADAAARAGLRQLKLYTSWRDAGIIRLGPGWAEDGGPGAPLGVGVLVEGADPIRSPEDVGHWAASGTVAVGLVWAMPGRYASGNATPAEADRGLTDAGRDLLAELDRHGIVHDLSHLSDRSLAGVLATTGGPVMASHSNARALLADANPRHAQRHLTDETIREIAHRGGVIGVNLFSSFLRAEGRATIADVVRQVEHIAGVAGDRRHVALGSDMDGGFSADRLPDGIGGPSDLWLIGEALSSAGWDDDAVAGFAWGNWARFWASRGRGSAPGAGAGRTAIVGDDAG